MQGPGFEWAEVSPGLLVIASAERAWVHRRSEMLGGGDVFRRPMDDSGPADAEALRRLLDGAIFAAEDTAAGERPPALTPLRWVYRLAGYYHTTHATPGLMSEAADRFAAMGRAELARWAATKAREEAGHDTLALRDIRAMGFAPERVLAVLEPETAMRLVALFTAYVKAEDPIACVGYAYALEKQAARRGGDYVAYVQGVLPAGVDATRCLRVHSAAGSDAAHVEDTVRVVAGLCGEERTQIALACYETAALCYEAPPGGHITDQELRKRLAAISNDSGALQ